MEEAIQPRPGRPKLRATVQEVMRYAGPRMLSRHPVLSLQHMLDQMRFWRSFRALPTARRSGKSNPPPDG